MIFRKEDIAFTTIHCKAVFECFNEALNMLRPYGKTGEPLKWSLRPRYAYKTPEDLVFILSNAKEIVLELNSMEAGNLPSIEFLFNNKFDEELFAETREKHLADILGQEVLEMEDYWINYEVEEVQSKLEIADTITELLIEETVNILGVIENKRKQV